MLVMPKRLTCYCMEDIVAKNVFCLLVFAGGFIVSLFIGWWGFPKLLYSQKAQPIAFSHAVHVNDAGMTCDQCHFFREDGSFSGLPTTESCAECHTEVLGESPEEQKFVEQYIDKGNNKLVPWYVYQKQPDNVYFSHAAHADLECTECHLDVASMDTPPPYQENKLTGYSRNTMKMWQCERCHANYGVSNACFVCHK